MSLGTPSPRLPFAHIASIRHAVERLVVDDECSKRFEQRLEAGSPVAFCSMLAADTGKTAAFAASIGTPAQAGELAEIKADNDAILAAAPSDVHDAVAKFYEGSAVARAALDPSLSAGAKAAAAANAVTAAGTPGVKAAIADHKTWVQTNYGSLSSKILSSGL